MVRTNSESELKIKIVPTYTQLRYRINKIKCIGHIQFKTKNDFSRLDFYDYKTGVVLIIFYFEKKH